MTSGIDGIYPKGFVIGTVESVEQERRRLPARSSIKPAVDFSALEEVLVVLTPTAGAATRPPESGPSESGRRR